MAERRVSRMEVLHPGCENPGQPAMERDGENPRPGSLAEFRGTRSDLILRNLRLQELLRCVDLHRQGGLSCRAPRSHVARER